MSIKQPKCTGVGDSVQVKQELDAWEMSLQSRSLGIG